jgi:hypothetical protein
MQLISGVWSSRLIITQPPPGVDEVSFLNNISELLTADQTKSYIVLGYHSKGDGGGSCFYWDSAALKTGHNGGTIIDPGRTFPTDWTNETQKTTWYTAASSGSGCWIALIDDATVDGRIFGIKFDNLTNPVTDNTKAFQSALNNIKTIYLPGGAYKITAALTIYDKMRLLAYSGKIKITSTVSNLLIANGTRDLTNLEFHGILETTATGNGDMVDIVDLTGNVWDWNFSETEYYSLNGNINGCSIVTSANNGNRTWTRNLNFRNCKFKTGRVGFECINHDNDLVISGISAANPGIVTVDTANIVTGQTVLMLGIVGTGAISALNEQFLIAEKINATTFKLKYADGTYVNTTGGTYISGGTVYVYRTENIDFTGSEVIATGLATIFPLGISVSGPSLNIKADSISGYNCATSIVEYIGASDSRIRDLRAYNCSGDLIQMTNTRIMYNNEISNAKTIGFSPSSTGMTLNTQKGLRLLNCDLNLTGKVIFNDCRDSFISGNKIVTKSNSGIEFRGNNANLPTTNNLMYDNFIDNTLYGSNNPVIIFGYPYCSVNIIDRLTAKSTGSLTVPYSEYSGANTNSVNLWRAPDTIGWLQAPPVTTLGNISLYNAIAGTDTKVFTKRDATLSTITFTLVQNNANGGQPYATFQTVWRGRLNNGNLGGTISIYFGSYSDNTATPGFTFTGSATPTLTYNGLNGSSQPNWTLTFPSNSEIALEMRITVRPEYGSSFVLS